MQFETINHTVGAWALNYLINGDLSGLDEWEDAAIKLWENHVTRPWVDADFNTWQFAHWSVDDTTFDDFARDEIMGLMGTTVTVTAHFVIATPQANTNANPMGLKELT